MKLKILHYLLFYFLFVKNCKSAPTKELNDENEYVPVADDEITSGKKASDPEIIRNTIKLEKYLFKIFQSKPENDQKKIRGILRKIEAIKRERLTRLGNKINEIKSRKDYEQNGKLNSAVNYIKMFIDVINHEAMDTQPKIVHHPHKLVNSTKTPVLNYDLSNNVTDDYYTDTEPFYSENTTLIMNTNDLSYTTEFSQYDSNFTEGVQLNEDKLDENYDMTINNAESTSQNLSLPSELSQENTAQFYVLDNSNQADDSQITAISNGLNDDSLTGQILIKELSDFSENNNISSQDFSNQTSN